MAFGRRSFVTVELENPSLLVVHLVEGENGKKERGVRGREGRQELRKE